MVIIGVSIDSVSLVQLKMSYQPANGLFIFFFSLHVLFVKRCDNLFSIRKCFTK